MASVNVELPSLLSAIANGACTIPLEAESLGGVLHALVERHPQLAVHLFDETRNLRQHVLCFHNGTNSRWLESLDVPVADGDTITILQAVSGG